MSLSWKPTFLNPTSLLKSIVLSAALLSMAVVATPAHAVPKTVSLEGVLLSSGGGPVSDGTYNVTFSVYSNATTKTPMWQEGPIAVDVKGGRFVYALGSKKAFSIKALAAAAAPELGVKVGADPELPRFALRSTLYALVANVAEGLSCSGCVTAGALAKNAVSADKLGFTYAGSSTKGGPANNLACTGCVSVKEMKFDGDVNLGGHSLKAKNGTFTGDVVANTVTATAFAGNGSKLTGLPIPKGSCPKGQVVRGVAADGGLLCAAALTGSTLPADGLAGVSNGLLTDQFTEQLAAGGLPVAIPDNTGSAASAKVSVPDLGTAQALSAQVNISNTNLGAVRLVLLPPNDKKKGLTLCDPCGKTDSKSLITSFPDKTATKTGDLKSWIGKNPKGEWLLKALDSKFCVVQAPGNAALCNTSKKTDGQIKAFSVTVKTLSSKKVGATGLFQLSLMSKPPTGCRASLRGSIFYDTTANGIRYCDGQDWRLLADTCGNGIKEITEECDDGNNTSGDGCSATCKVGRGLSSTDPAPSCKALLAVAKGSKSGSYWLDVDGPGPGKAGKYLCDMSKDGGGWTRMWSEASAVAGGWSVGNLVTGSVNGAKSTMHGPFGQNVNLSKTISLGAIAHSQVRVAGRYFAIDSWDGEYGRVYVDGGLVFNRSKVYSQTGGSYWTTVSFSPAPWTGPSKDGYWDLWAAAGARNHTAKTVTVRLTSTLNQAASDESWLADRLAIWVR